MTSIEIEMVKFLIKLRRQYNVVEVKAEFETEGARIEELMRLKEIVEKAEVGLIIKIGGAEAVTDMFAAQRIGVSGIIAPMIETSYAMKKYLEAIKKHFPKDQVKDIHFGINVETDTAYKNIHKILNAYMVDLIDTVTLGRVDMCGSLELSRDEINSEVMYKIAEDIFTLAKEKGFRTTMGGGIEPMSVQFINRLVKKNLLDRYETRKIVFKTSNNFNKIAEGILKAHEFELLWLKNKKNYYFSIFNEDDARIEMLKKRITGS